MSEAQSDDVTVDDDGNPIAADNHAPLVQPRRIGRYRIEQLLGSGGFGLVYRGYDEQLDRPVAVKVPHRRLMTRPGSADAYLSEARTVARLDHPAIVPVYDVGSSAEHGCYIVSRYIEGADLARWLRQKQMTWREAAGLVVTVADALHYAHKQGLVHRDIKPGNILIGVNGCSHVVDFGLALTDGHPGDSTICAGTPGYMSPEQARGEGHRVDGRSDIFSLGVVFYQLLTGRQPFRGDSQSAILEQVISREPRPLRQYNEQLPRELERICLRALAKRAAERYSSAHDLADDLRSFLADSQSVSGGPAAVRSVPLAADVATRVTPPSVPRSGNDDPVSPSSSASSSMTGSDPLRIVPRGLRSFDAQDADFFIELLPGPRDRAGIPDSVRFWKKRIEETDPDQTFTVGLIYGPSGCGKTSLVRAALLPRVNAGVTCVYIEATPEETETRMLRGLRKYCPALDERLSLRDSFAALRRGQAMPAGRKLLIVLDQFEQWLHARPEVENSELVQALRQCDGGRVQCIVMVRDDFWLAVSRFLRALEVRLVEGHNIALADLFDMDHARKVLAAFGRAFGRLPQEARDMSREQKDFLSQAVNGLAVDGKVICVRLALFAEMMKGRVWTPTTLKQVGGARGVGMTFLEETFSSPAASPEHRYHQRAARAVLGELLPGPGTDIKGHMRSATQLQIVSGYTERPRDFEDLLRILDSEVRLISPTDPHGAEADNTVVPRSDSGQKYYQLTHDYLVHSLREWLTRKQRESRRGRAELRLSELAAAWDQRREDRFLPGAVDHIRLRLLTDRRSWTESQRQMMARALKFHGSRLGAAATVILLMVFLGLRYRAAEIRRANVARAAGLVTLLEKADTAQVPEVLRELSPELRPWADPLLRRAWEDAASGSSARLHYALALMPVDEQQVSYLAAQLPVCAPAQFQTLRAMLAPAGHRIAEPLWLVVSDTECDPQQRFQGAAALAEFDSKNERWATLTEFVAQFLTTSLPTTQVSRWTELFRPVGTAISDQLLQYYREGDLSAPQRESVAYVLSEYLREQPRRLAEVILLAGEAAEFQPLMDGLRPHAAAVRSQLQEVLSTALPESLARANEQLTDAEQQLRDAHWRRQALAGVALLQLGFPEDLRPALKYSADPSLRSYLIDLLGRLNASPSILAAELEDAADDSVRCALIQSLGGLRPDGIPAAEFGQIVDRLRDLYLSHPDSGLHGCTAWTLRRWGQQLPSLPAGMADRNWFVNSQNQVMVVIRPAAESAASGPDYAYAVSSHEVTVAEFLRFRPEHTIERTIAPEDDCPVHDVNWYDAAEYCNWLSLQDEIPEDQWAYLPNDSGRYDAGMTIRTDAPRLAGYRLPSRSEWEAACRIGTRSTYSFGEPVPLLHRYAWYIQTAAGRSHPVESLLPNAAGLFDMHGNVWEWVEDAVSGARSPIQADTARLLQGGSLVGLAWDVRSDNVYSNKPLYAHERVGFRVVRTLPDDTAHQ